MSMPNKPRPENPNRNIRVEDELWDQAREIARTDRTSVSEVVREAIRQYVGRRKEQGK